MNFSMLRKLRDELLSKTNRTIDEEKLLKELTSLNALLDKFDFSLSMSSGNCPACGRPLEK